MLANIEVKTNRQADTDLSPQQLLKAYRLMVAIRKFEERAGVEFERGNIPGFVHLYAGQEASAVGVCTALTDEDKIASTHRGHGHCIAKGTSVSAMMQEIFGKRTGLCKGKGGSMHIADLSKGMLGANGIVGGGPPLVVGAALTSKTRNDKTVAVAFTGDGGSNQGTVFEAMNMAVVLQVPAIFVFENNGWGEGTGHDYAVGSRDIAGRASGFGLPAEKIDGTDFFAVYAAAAAAVARARQGGGPSVIEVVNKRFHGHYLGDPMLYRTAVERETTRATMDPLLIFRQKVTAARLLDTGALDEIDNEVDKLIEEAVQAASDAPAPTASDLECDVYASY